VAIETERLNDGTGWTHNGLNGAKRLNVFDDLNFRMVRDALNVANGVPTERALLDSHLIPGAFF
jgi:hypothetical protein